MEKKKKKPIIGYGANMGAGKKATKKAVKKVVAGVTRSAYKTVKPSSKSVDRWSGRTEAKESNATKKLPKSYGKASLKRMAVANAMNKIKPGALSARANISTNNQKGAVKARKDYIAAYNAQVKKNKGKKK